MKLIHYPYHILNKRVTNFLCLFWVTAWTSLFWYSSTVINFISEYGFILSDLKEYLCIIMAISFFYSFRKALKGMDNGD